MEAIVTLSGVFVRKQDMQDKPAIWFVHGFGDSGFCFLEAFDAPDLRDYSLHVPDFPGFGVSVRPTRSHTIDDTASLLLEFIRPFRAPVILVAHSLGGLIATKVATALPSKVKGLINVEGNLTRADCFYSGKWAQASDPVRFKKEFLDEIYRKGLENEAIRRYFVSLKMASAEALQAWGKTGVEATGEKRGGEDFLKVTCPKLYVYGKKSIPEQSKAFLEKHKDRIETMEFENSGHWPMIDETEKFYQTIAEFVKKIF